MSDPILDALNAPAVQKPGGDAILEALNGATPTPAPARPTFAGTKTGAAFQGANDLQNAGAQWLYNSLPAPVQRAGDAVDHWLHERTGGAIGTKPGMTFNNAVADQNANYEASRQANGRDGIDWTRILSGSTAQTGAMLLGGAPAKMTSMTAGLLGGALMPATNMPEGGNGADFALQKAKDIGFGGTVGKALGMLGGTVANVLSPKVDPAARKLMDAGMQLTPGQMYGGWVKGLEDKMTSVPVFGDLIKSAQGRSVEGLNTAAYKRVLDPLAEAGISVQVPKTAGREGVESVTSQVKAAYNELVPKLAFRADQQFSTEMQGLRTLAKDLPPSQLAEFDRIMLNKVDKHLATGGSSGKTLQGMLSDLGSLVTGYRSDLAFANRQLGDALATVEQSIKDGLMRSNPQQAQTLSKINEAFASLARVQSAAASQGAHEGVFSGAQLAAAVKGGDKTVRDNAYAQGKALMQDLSDPAKKLLTASVPDSGTPGRAMAAGAAGAVMTNPLQLLNPAVIATALPSLLYTKPGQAAVNLAGAQRPPGVQALADQLRQVGQQTAQPLNAAALRLLTEQLSR